MRKLSLPARIGLIAVAVVLVLCGIAQLALAPLAENRIEDRLTEGGGTARASIDAFPAVALLLGDGDALEVSGEGLDLELNSEETVFERLDGFDRVDVDLRDFRAGPFEIESFVMERDGDQPYALRSALTTTGSELLAYGAERLGVPGSAFLPLITGDDREANVPIPIELDMELESDDGRILVTSGGGEVAGYPTGPLAELITSAIVVQI